MKTILFTGGGSAGHVTPNIALIHRFLAAGWKVTYAGSRRGIERQMIAPLGVAYYAITVGKLRRYFSWRTLIEPVAIMMGIIQAFFLCHRLRPAIVFSKGGFVAFPIVIAAWLNRIPIVIHESDLTPGLANKLSFPFADKICISFEEGKQYIAANNMVVTGNPIRDALLQGSADRGREFCRFNPQKPILVVVGGGQGAAIINQTIWDLLPRLLASFQVVHLCGKGKVREDINHDGYKQFEYLQEELADIFACADLVVSRAGSNSVYELLRLRKPHILIPLSLKASRGDQIVNARYFANRGLSYVLEEEDLNTDSLFHLIGQVYSRKDELHQRLLDFSLPDSNLLIYKEITQLCNY